MDSGFSCDASVAPATSFDRDVSMALDPDASFNRDASIALRSQVPKAE
jgi:hypothetical protein